MQQHSPLTVMPEDSLNLLDYLEVIIKRKSVIIYTTGIAIIASIIISLNLPVTYCSTAKILPPQQDQNVMSLMLGQLGGMGSLAGEVLGKGSPADVYVGILTCDAVSDKIIDRFNLQQLYNKKTRIDTYSELQNNVEITAGKKDGIIRITVEDTDPKRAAEIANAYVEEIGKLTVQLNNSGASQNRAFLEERISKSKADLAKTEDRLKAFQSKNKVISISEQSAATITGIAQIQAQLAAQEMQLAVLQHQFTPSSQEVKNAKASIANLRQQISRLEGSGSGGTIPGAGTVPELGQQYLRLMREFKIQENLLELLTKQYEVLKLSEAKDVSSVQIVQPARVPDKKSKPRRSLIVAATTFIAAFFSVIAAFGCESLSRMSEEDKQRFNTIIMSLKFNKKKQIISPT